MQRVDWGGQAVTRLGFGGSVLGNLSERGAARLIDAALAAGIRHFDVAPLYGFGKAEARLGRLLGSRRGDVTITTKYGLEPPAGRRWIAPVHRIARAMLHGVPAIKRRVQAAAGGTVTQAPEADPLTAEACRVSLARSLRELRTERLDVLLLHEATPDRLQDGALLDLLEDARRRGRIGAFGIGSERDAAEACLRERAQFCPVVQTEWSVFSGAALDDNVSWMLFGVFGGRVEFPGWLLGDRQRARRWSEETGVDVAAPRMLPRLVFKAALQANPGKPVLFSTTRVEHLEENVGLLEDTSLTAAATRFAELVQKEYR